MKIHQYESPFRHWVIEGFADATLARAAYDAVAYDSPIATRWAFYNNPDEWKRATNDFDSLPLPARDLAASLVTDWTAGMVEVIAGVANLEGDPTWHGGGYHVTDSGGHLGPHIDYALNPRTGMERRVNLILYLNECAGGELCLWNDDATEIEATVKPLFNRAVLWLPGDTTFHSVRPVERGPRVSLACYYVTPPRAGCNRRRALFVPNRGTNSGSMG
jgi:hypothetical protein